MLLIGSNVFMTTAWYWHLRFKEVSLFQVIADQLGPRLLEYCLAVPANRYGSAIYNPAQLKTIQEVITLLGLRGVFVSSTCSEPITLEPGVGFALIAAGAFFRLPRTV